MATLKKLMDVSADTLKALNAGNVVLRAKNFVGKETLITVPAKSWRLEEKTITKNGQTFTLKIAVFEIAGVKDPYERTFASGVDINLKNEIAIKHYVATRDDVASTGKVIKKGDTRQYACNA